jgi:hypothetical protein
MKKYGRSFSDWTLSNDDRIHITYIDAKGSTVEELLDDAAISFEDWHGNPILFNWCADDLSGTDFDQVKKLFEDFLNA